MTKQLLTIIILLSTPIHAATFTVHEYIDGGGHYINMHGPVEEGDEKRLHQAWLHDNIKSYSANLHLDSKGGNLYAMEEIIKFVKEKEINTAVTEECWSACAEIWLAGKDRFLHKSAESKLGFHISSINDPMYFSEIMFTNGILEVQRDVQANYSLDIDRLMDNYTTKQPYKFVYFVSKYGYDAHNFYTPTNHDIEYIIGGITYGGE